MTESNFRVARVDERDSCWEQSDAKFRVYFQSAGGANTFRSTDTFDLDGGDFLQALDWAKQKAGQEWEYSIALVYDDRSKAQPRKPNGRGLVWLLGHDRNDVEFE